MAESKEELVEESTVMAESKAESKEYLGIKKNRGRALNVTESRGIEN
jgi:hypothetical protein